LFGIPSDAAFIVEKLVMRKYNSAPTSEENESFDSTPPTQNAPSEQSSLKLYAEFVERYTQAYDSQRLSTMRWMIAEGECDWGREQYLLA
jgi:hypothetical protein